MTLEFQNQINIQPTEESGGGGDTPVIQDIGTMYQQTSSDGTTFGTYSEMASNTVAELARLRPFDSSDTGLLDYWDYTGTLSLTVKFTYRNDVNSAWYGNPFIIIYANGDGNYHSGVAHVENNQLRIAYTGAPTKQLTAGHTYTIKLSLNADTNNALLYCKEEGVDSDFVLVDSHTATSTASVTRAYIEIDNNITEGYQKPYHKFADFNLTDITIDIDGEVIFLRTEGGSGGGGSTPSSDAIGIPREISAQGALILPTNITAFELPEEVTELGNGALNYAFNHCTSLLTVDLSNVQTVGYHGLYYAFSNCPNLTSVDLSGLTTINGTAGAYSMCNGCSSLTSIDISNLTTASAENALSYFFSGCTSITTMTFPKLQNINGNQALSSIFNNCTALTTVYFPALKASSFTTYTNQFTGAFTGCSNVKIHFPSNLQGKFSTTGLGGSNIRMAYDLPATT